MKIKIIAKSRKPEDVKVINSETNELIEGITNLSIHYTAGDLTSVDMTLVGVEVDIELDGNMIAKEDKLYAVPPMQKVFNTLIANFDFEKEYQLMIEEKAKNESISN